MTRLKKAVSSSRLGSYLQLENITQYQLCHFNKTRSSSPVSVVPSVLLNPEDSQWREVLEEVGGKTMKNKCYYIIIKQDDNANKIIELDRGNVKYF